jgi:hypothetical protein
MENGRWKMEDGKWKMADRKWKTKYVSGRVVGVLSISNQPQPSNLQPAADIRNLELSLALNPTDPFTHLWSSLPHALTSHVCPAPCTSQNSVHAHLTSQLWTWDSFPPTLASSLPVCIAPSIDPLTVHALSRPDHQHYLPCTW